MGGVGIDCGAGAATEERCEEGRFPSRWSPSDDDADWRALVCGVTMAAPVAKSIFQDFVAIEQVIAIVAMSRTIQGLATFSPTHGQILYTRSLVDK